MDDRNFIFLDIDGVLNAPGDIELIEGMFEKNKLDSFIKLMEETKSVLIIISSRRHYDDEKTRIIKTFSNTSFLDDIYFLPETKCLKRADEIQQFINKYDIVNFVVLDDNDDNNSLYFKEKFINIGYMTGLNIEDIIKIKSILK